MNLEKVPWWGGIFERLARSVKKCIDGATITYEELLTATVEVELILTCRTLSYVSSEEFEEPLTASRLFVWRAFKERSDSNVSETLGYDIDVQHDLSRGTQQLNNVLNHFWKSWRNECLIRNSHHYLSQGDTSRAPLLETVVVHDETLPSVKWHIGKISAHVARSVGCIRGAVVHVRSKGGRSTKLKRSVQRLYQLETHCQALCNKWLTLAQDVILTQCPLKRELSYLFQDGAALWRAAAVEADLRVKTWLEELN